MENTENLALPYLMPAQAQKHVTHNEAIRMLDAVVQIGVASRANTDPPATPAPGERHIVAAGAGGAWLGRDDTIAAYQDGVWMFYPPRPGWIVWVADETLALTFDGGAWIKLLDAVETVNPAPLIGVNATADATNRLAVASAATLFNHAGAGHQMKINKSASGETASVVFQDNWSGRAEMGLAGDDDFRFKVSGDGGVWHEALVIAAASGRVVLPATPPALVNMLEDSGRLSTPSAAIAVPAFAAPAYLTAVTATFSAHGKFIDDNSNFGGSGANMTADAQDLVTKIRTWENGNIHRRHGPEFHIASLVKGAAMQETLTHNATNYGLALGSTPIANLPAYTVHFYARAKTGNLLVEKPAPGTAAIYVDDAEQAGHYELDPAEGWRSIRIEYDGDPFSANGYAPEWLRLYQAAENDEALIACPAVVAGLQKISIHQGLLPAATFFAA